MLSWWMIILLLIYIVICLMLMAAILLQSGKGGGLSSLAGGSSGISDAIGATGAEKMMNRVTTGVAVSFMLMAILLSLLGRYTGPDHSSEVFGSGDGEPVMEEIPSMVPDDTEEVPLEPIVPGELPELPLDPAS